MASGFTWNEWSTAEAERLWKQGDSASEIARALGDKFGLTTSRNSVIGKMHRRGLASRALPSAPAGTKPKLRTVHLPPKNHPRPPRAPKPAPVLVQSDAIPVSLLQLSKRVCHWPLAGSEGEDTLFCGAEAHGTYCPAHRAASVRPSTSGKSMIHALRRYL